MYQHQCYSISYAFKHPIKIRVVHHKFIATTPNNTIFLRYRLTVKIAHKSQINLHNVTTKLIQMKSMKTLLLSKSKNTAIFAENFCLIQPSFRSLGNVKSVLWRIQLYFCQLVFCVTCASNIAQTTYTSAKMIKSH